MKRELVYCKVEKTKVYKDTKGCLDWDCSTCPKLKYPEKITERKKISETYKNAVDLDSEALHFAKLFLKGEINHSLFQEAFTKKQWEEEFPFNCTDPERKENRNSVWKEISSCVKDSSVIKDCKAALIVFSSLLIPYNALQGTEFKYESFIPLLPLEYFDQNKKDNKPGLSRKSNAVQERTLSRNHRTIKKEIEHLKNISKILYLPKSPISLKEKLNGEKWNLWN